MMEPLVPEWEIRIEHDGMWPNRWTWQVWYTCYEPIEVHVRSGSARTKDKAQRAAAAARVSIERDDLTIHERV